MHPDVAFPFFLLALKNYLLFTSFKEKRGLSKLTSKVSVIIDDDEKAFLRQPANQKPDLAKVNLCDSR